LPSFGVYHGKWFPEVTRVRPSENNNSLEAFCFLKPPEREWPLKQLFG